MAVCQQLHTHNLLDDLAGGVQVNKALVHLELVTIPGLGTLTTRLGERAKSHENQSWRIELLCLQSYGW